jgi:OmcA/MtrC family decaheme c-type cytochrome
MSVARTPLAVVVCVSLAFACAGPAGKDGAQGPAGPTGDAGVAGDPGLPGTPQALTAETCVLCHGAGQLADTTTMHKAAASPAMTRNLAMITSASIPASAPIKPTITFTVTDPSTGSPVTGLSSFNFTVAQLVPTDADGGSIDNWRPVLTRNYGTAPDISPGGAVEVSANARSATTPAAQLSGVLVESPPGTYTYTFGNDLSVTQTLAAATNFGVVTTAFDPSLTTRFGVQSGAPILGQNPGTAPNGTVIQPTAPFTATADVLPGGTLFTNADSTVANQQKHDSRAIVTAAACDQCHQRLTAHGRRVNVNYCVTCHNSSSFDPKTPAADRQTVDFKRVIHKLHMGKNLPSVKAGGTFTFNGQDFSDVSFPVMSSNGTSDPGNCTVCHNANSATLGAPADYWKTKPTMAACGSCHDRTSFEQPAPAGWTLHTGGPQPNDQLCTACHASGAGIAPVDLVHTGLSSVQATLTGKYKYNIVKVENTAPGQTPVVTFQVLNPAAANAPYTLTEAAWTQVANGNSRLAIDIAWSTRPVASAGDTNFTNDGSGSMPGQPVSIDALKNKVAGAAAGTFTVTSPVPVPANALGVGQVVMEGHPAEPVGKPAVMQRIPVQSATKTFAVTGTATTARRKVVDINKCNVCHVNLTLHGSNRTSSIETCVSCHNTNATDIRQRPKTGTTLDDKAEESIDFKKLIHGIHGADFSGNGPVIYGFGGSANDFRATGFPGVINNCEGCHNPGTYTAGFADANGTATSTETLADPSTYLRTTKVTATCSACHSQKLTVDHMLQNGGRFDLTQAQIDAANK